MTNENDHIKIRSENNRTEKAQNILPTLHTLHHELILIVIIYLIAITMAIIYIIIDNHFSNMS